MQVRLEISGSTFTAKLKLPRALVLSAVITIAGFVAEAIRCETNIRNLRAQLAQCLHKPTTPLPAQGYQ